MQKKMPLVEAMLKYKSENIYPFHTPGHKGGRGMEDCLRQELGESVRMDVSLMSELDDIHEPETYIAEAQRLAAETYGSDACFWAVNGTSQAIHAMLMGALKPGEKVLVPRNAHRSVAGGLVLGGLKARYIEPLYQEKFGIFTQVSPQQIKQALQNDAEIKAVLITSPNYYGIAADVEAIAEICHKHGVPLLVDEAHGPHLGFNNKLPASAMQCGADACAQSTHKIAGAMTQCSMLQVRQGLLDLQHMADVMSILTTTSPNYLLMASLDAARAQLQEDGYKMIEDALAAAQKLVSAAESFDGIHVLTKQDVPGMDLDATKVTVNFADWGISGIAAGEAFRKAGIAVELVDPQNVLFLVTYADYNAEFDEVLCRIKSVLQNLKQQKNDKQLAVSPARIPAAAEGMSLRDVFFSSKRSIPLTESAGYCCSEQISFYPPGIPVILPGELITQEIIDYCIKMKELGLPVSGPADSSLKLIRVVSR